MTQKMDLNPLKDLGIQSGVYPGRCFCLSRAKANTGPQNPAARSACSGPLPAQIRPGQSSFWGELFASAGGGDRQEEVVVTEKSLDSEVAARLVTTPHGLIYVSDRGGDEPAVVLMHGFPDDSRIYARLAPELSPQRSVAFDFAGMAIRRARQARQADHRRRTRRPPGACHPAVRRSGPLPQPRAGLPPRRTVPSRGSAQRGARIPLASMGSARKGGPFDQGRDRRLSARRAR